MLSTRLNFYTFLRKDMRDVISLLHLISTELRVVTNVRNNNHIFPCDFAPQKYI